MALDVKEFPHKGRGLVTTRLVRGGETILTEAPLLLTVASSSSSSTCSTCLRLLSSDAASCSGCHQASFCGAACAQAAGRIAWGHTPEVCRAYALLGALSLPAEQTDQLRFLVQVSRLLQLGPADADQRFQKLLSLSGDASEQDVAAASQLLPHLHAIGVPHVPSALEVATLLRKEQLNSYGVLAPHGRDGERHVRGSGIYLQASMINHECAPNVARFDYFDSDRPDSTHIHFKALHDLPPGTEVAQSYVPLNWDFHTRQKQCREVYGFVCNCPRCQTESQQGEVGGASSCGSGSEGSWQTDDGGSEDEGEGDAIHEDDDMNADAGDATTTAACEEEHLPDAVVLPPGDEPPLEPTYLALFLLKYVCPRRGCFGTLAPIGLGADVAECNVCGRQRTEQQFLESLNKKDTRK